MFSVTVRDHMMIAHSFRGEVSARLSACTVRRTWSTQHSGARRSMPTTSSSTSDAAAQQLHAVVAELSYRNLDDEPAFEGMNTSTEALAQVVADRLAERAHAGALGEAARELDGLVVTLHESHVAWASYERPL